MQIQLRQAEIVAAITQYVARQGISLTGKSVDVAFTNGRNPAGLVADISIEEVVAAPAVEAAAPVAPAPTLVYPMAGIVGHVEGVTEKAEPIVAGIAAGTEDSTIAVDTAAAPAPVSKSLFAA
jgi:hypothetical protein